VISEGQVRCGGWNISSASAGMAVPEGLRQFKQINSLCQPTLKSGPNTFQGLIAPLAKRNEELLSADSGHAADEVFSNEPAFAGQAAFSMSARRVGMALFII
jgi:hypothetical protein